MSKYANGVFFTSPYSNISPPSTSFDMARSSSRDSTSSTSRYCPTSHPMSRGSSTTSYHPTSTSMRRTSSSSSQSTWIASPYRSCLNRGSSFGSEEASSYLSEDDLLCLASLPVESIPSPCLKKPERKEMTTEEQIQRLRELQEQEEREERQRRDSGYQSASARRKTVRFEPEVQRKPRRPSVKRRSTAGRTGPRNLNGPM